MSDIKIGDIVRYVGAVRLNPDGEPSAWERRRSSRQEFLVASVDPNGLLGYNGWAAQKLERRGNLFGMIAYPNESMWAADHFFAGAESLELVRRADWVVVA